MAMDLDDVDGDFAEQDSEPEPPKKKSAAKGKAPAKGRKKKAEVCATNSFLNDDLYSLFTTDKR